MKPGARQHPKMYRLARRLGIPHYAAVGIIESIIDFTAKYAPAGDIGRYSDDDLCSSLGWEKESATLIDALTQEEWVERHENCACRLILHDWHEHAPDSVQMSLARSGKRFANGEKPNVSRLSKPDRERAEKRLRNARTLCTCRAHGVHTVCALPPPPLPSPPLPPPVLHTSCARENGVSLAPQTVERSAGATLQAADRWSERSRGHALMANDRGVFVRLLLSLAQSPPVVRGTTQTPGDLLAAEAIDALIVEGVEFKSGAYAAGCVRNRIDEWRAAPLSTQRTPEAAPLDLERDRAETARKWGTQ